MCFQNGTVFITTPLSLIISDDLELLPKNFSRGLEEKFMRGALFLVAEKAKGRSMWQPFIDILPERVDATIMFTEDEMDQLKGSLVSRSVCKWVMSTTHHLLP